jgi:hypothetical protein
MIYKTDKPKKPAPKPKKQPKPATSGERALISVPFEPVIAPPMIVPIDPDEWPEGHAPMKDEDEK